MSTKSITKVCLWCPMFSLHWPLIPGQKQDNLLCAWGRYENYKVFSGDKLVLTDCNLYPVEGPTPKDKKRMQGRLTFKNWLKLLWWRIKIWWRSTDSEADPIELVAYRQTEEFNQVKAQIVVLSINKAGKNGILLEVL